MKSICLSLLFVMFCLVFEVPAFAIDYVDVHSEGCGSGRTLKDTFTKVNKGATDFDGCDAAVRQFRDEVMALSTVNIMDCVGFMSFTVDCYLMLVNVCCDNTYMSTVHNQTDIVVSHNVITGVPAGAEISAAETYFTQFKADAVPPVKSGLVVTDVYAGYVYSGNLNSESQLTDVTIDAWKRVGYTGTGVNPIPLDSIGSSGGSGSGGLTSGQTTSAVAAALEAQGLSGAALEAKMKSSLDYGHNQGYFDSGGGTGGGLNYSDTVDAINEAINTNHGNFTGTLTLPDPYAIPETSHTLNETYDSFVDTVKDSEFYSIGNSFFSGVPTSGGDPPVIVVNGGNTFGQHTFDFSVLSPFLAIIKSCVILAFCFISVRLLVVNK